MRGYTQDKDAYLKRLRRIEGQVRGLQRMVDEDVYCIDILTQVSAVKSALQSVSVGLVEDHLGHCVQDALHGGDLGEDVDAVDVLTQVSAVKSALQSALHGGDLGE